jgi:BMFP domain-containing protein YqiC
VVASDADNLTGPHQASGTPWTFQIVSDDELIALVALKELNIRRRFEQILEELRNTRKDLLLHRTRLEEAQVLRGRDAATRTAADAEKLAVLETGALTSVERATSGARKNHNELQSIEEEFRDVRDELANNAIPDVRPMLERMDDGILRPLRQVNADDFNAIDDLLVKGRDQLETQENPLGTLELTTDQLGATITKLEGVLAQMLKNEDYNKVLEMLRSVIRGQEELKKQTELERKKKLIEGLK